MRGGTKRWLIVDVLSQLDVADNSLGTLVHDAICSIARSPVFAQRHEVAIYMWLMH